MSGVADRIVGSSLANTFPPIRPAQTLVEVVPAPLDPWNGIGMNVARRPCCLATIFTTYFSIAALSAVSSGEAGADVDLHLSRSGLGLARLDGDVPPRAASSGSPR